MAIALKGREVPIGVECIAERPDGTRFHWKKELNANYPMLSDHMRKVSEQYGVLITQMGVSNRATFVIDKDGKIANIEEGNQAINVDGADEACSRLAHKKAAQ